MVAQVISSSNFINELANSNSGFGEIGNIANVYWCHLYCKFSLVLVLGNEV